MKKVSFWVILIVLALTASFICFAQQMCDMKSQETDKEMKGHNMMKMHPGFCMDRMMQGEMLATKDGGIVVMFGNKLLKYDKDLNLKKEVDIKIDMKEMHEMMMQCMEKCQMHKKMMEKSSMDSSPEQ